MTPRQLKEWIRQQDPERDVRATLCQRCHQLKNRSANVVRSFPRDPEKYFRQLRALSHGLIVYVLDVFDLEASLIPTLEALVGSNKRLVIAVNKVDALPVGTPLEKVRNYLWQHHFHPSFLGRRLSECLEGGREDIHLVSAASGDGMAGLVRRLAAARGPGTDIFLVGRVNVGKSRLVHAMERLAGPELTRRDAKAALAGSKRNIVSPLPGTTVEMVKIPLESPVFGDLFRKPDTSPGSVSGAHVSTLIDTPGVATLPSILDHLSFSELRMVIPKAPMKPATWELKPGKSLFLGGMARLDFLGFVTELNELVPLVEPLKTGPRGSSASRPPPGPPNPLFTVCISSMVKAHRTDTAKADALYAKHLGQPAQSLRPPVAEADTSPAASPRLAGWPGLTQATELTLDAAPAVNGAARATKDIVVPGIGWVGVAGKFGRARVRVWTPGPGLAVTTREPLLPLAFKSHRVKMK